MIEDDLIGKISSSLFNGRFFKIYNPFGYSNIMKAENTETTVYIDKNEGNVVFTKTLRKDSPNAKVSIATTNL